MAPITQASDESNHQALLDQLDFYGIRKPFRKPNWKPAQRRNKNVKQILSEASRKEASVAATQNNSGATTPALNNTQPNPNLENANQEMLKPISEARQRKLLAAMGGPSVTYTNVESAPSLHPSSQRHYCDVTGLPAPYTDPKTRLRYHNAEIYGLLRTMPQGSSEQYLAARGAHTVLK